MRRLDGLRSEPLTIVSTRPLSDERRAEILAIAPAARLVIADTESSLEETIGEADIVAGSVSERAFARARRLRWIHSWVAGQDEQLFQELVESRTILTSSAGNGAVPLAEHAMMLMLMLNRDALRWIEAQRQRKWDRHRHAELCGLTCGIIGTGHSGTDLALKAKAFHMRVVGLRRNPRPTPGFDVVHGRDGLPQLLAESDFVVVSAPLTPETKDLLGEAEFRAMKPTAYYICFSRGGIANDDALYKALSEKWIAGAGLDAHAREPLSPDSKFWALPNVIITPHNGATTPATMDRAHRIFVANLERFVGGEPLENVVDKQAGY